MNPSARLERAVAFADKLIALTESVSPGGRRGDMCSLVMFAAYLHGLRRFRAIRNLAADGAGAEAAILTRSLLSVLARAIYVDEPTDAEVRHERWVQFARTDAKAAHDLACGLRDAGFPVEAEEIAVLSERKDELGDCKRLPNDRELMPLVGLAPHYWRIYQPTSDLAHFGLAGALAEVYGVEQVDTRARDDDLAGEALSMAVILFGTLLAKSERSVQHGLMPAIEALVAEEDVLHALAG
jgi:hypothetical protein